MVPFQHCYDMIICMAYEDNLCYRCCKESFYFFLSKLQRRVCGFCFLREVCKFAPSWHTALFVSVREKEGELYSWRFIYLFWLNVSSKEKDLSASNIFFNNILMNFSPIKAEKLLTFMHVLGFLKLTFKNAVKVNNTNKRKCSVTFTELY